MGLFALTARRLFSEIIFCKIFVWQHLPFWARGLQGDGSSVLHGDGRNADEVVRENFGGFSLDSGARNPEPPLCVRAFEACVRGHWWQRAGRTATEALAFAALRPTAKREGKGAEAGAGAGARRQASAPFGTYFLAPGPGVVSYLGSPAPPRPAAPTATRHTIRAAPGGRSRSPSRGRATSASPLFFLNYNTRHQGRYRAHSNEGFWMSPSFKTPCILVFSLPLLTFPTIWNYPVTINWIFRRS